MKKLLSSLGLSTLIWAMMGSSTLAMCIWFAPPGRQFEPANNMKILLSKHDDKQQLVVQPQFKGDATDFALVMPFSSKPEIKEAPKRIFERLEDLTNPVQDFGFEDCINCAVTLESTEDSRLKNVEVVEERDVGEYSTTTLKATDADELLEWLQNNGYEVPDSKKQTLEYYVGEDTGYFVALKVNLEEAKVGSDGQILGELDPLVFEGKGDSAVLPLRLMADEEMTELVDLVIYTLGDEELYIPGAELQYAQKLSSRDIRDTKLGDFAERSDWLVRNRIQIQPSEIEVDLVLRVAPKDVVVDVNSGQTIRLNPDLLDDDTGLISPPFIPIRYVDEDEAPDSDNSSSSDPEDKASTESLLLVAAIGLSVLNVVVMGYMITHHRRK